jgi:hypothetical protein
MAVITGPWLGLPVSITDGTTQVQFDMPSDLADWLQAEEERVGRPVDLSQWTWVTAPVLSDS